MVATILSRHFFFSSEIWQGRLYVKKIAYENAKISPSRCPVPDRVYVLPNLDSFTACLHLTLLPNFVTHQYQLELRMITRLLNPFYVPLALPQPTSSVTAHTPIELETAHQVLPIAHQELPIAHRELPSRHRFGRKTAVKRVSFKQPYPLPKLRTIRSCSPDSVASSANSDADIDADVDALIQKPEGEAGRPGRGGYNLEVAVGWSAKEYNELKVGPSSSTLLPFLKQYAGFCPQFGNGTLGRISFIYETAVGFRATCPNTRRYSPILLSDVLMGCRL
jgi:hypothetical protein